MCRLNGADCFDLNGLSLEVFAANEARRMAKNSSALIDNGRAGTLSRFEELVEFWLQGYGKIGLAYCFGLESLAKEVRDKMTDAGLSLIPARCSMGGVRERDIDPLKTTEAYSCNPVGQAAFLNERADFVVEMGLCLGHDVLFHQELTVPFTVLLVKDRVHGHAPLEGIRNYSVKL